MSGPPDPAGRPREQAGDGRDRGVSPAGLIIAALLGLLAFGLVVQVRSNTGDSQLETARQDDLVRILSDLNNREQRLRAEIATLEDTLRRLGAGAEGREAALEQARRRADELAILAGTIPAQGEGIEIQLIPGSGPIRAATVLQTVQELRGAGAEALQIEGVAGRPVRIVASSYFADGPRGLVVDATELTGPYVVTVIGPAETMKTALTIPGGVVDAVARDGGTVIVSEPGVVRVPAVRQPPPLEHARPVE